MMLFDIAVVGCIVIFFIGLVVAVLCMVFQDTETFRAIDEKIANLIREKEE